MVSAIFIGQGASIELLVNLAEQLELERIGIYASHLRWFQDYVRKAPFVEKEPFHILKEWEIYENLPQVDDSVLAHYDKLFGYGELWQAVVTDRRAILGRNVTLHQDYRPRFDNERLLRILQGHLQAFQSWWDSIEPDYVVAYNCVTIGDYLIYLFARANNVPYLNLRATKIQDYVQYEPHPFQASVWLADVLQTEAPQAALATAEAYIQQVRHKNALYEGVRKAFSPEATQLSGSILKSAANMLRDEFRYRTTSQRRDNHTVSPLKERLNHRVFSRVRRWQHDTGLSKHYVTEESLADMKYVFFPMHSEPEVALLVNARPYLNQIEVIRYLAMSLPVTSVLLVKDHPLAYTRRSRGYYRKLLEIPNVRLIHPRVASRPVIQSAQAVVVITGSIGLEAAILGKPVICLSNPPYTLLPDSMVRYVPDLHQLPATLQDLIETYKADDEALHNLIAHQVNLSASIKLYSVLLGRKNVVQTGVSEYSTEIQKLAAYTQSVLKL